MQGLIQSSPLTADRLLRHAVGAHGQAEVITAALEGAPRRLSYAQLELRVRRLAGALAESGVGKDDCVAVIGAATARQIEAWFAVMMTGATCHPINPVHAPDQVAALLRAHGDKAVFVDPDLLEALEPALLKLPQLERVIAMGEAGQALPTRMNAVVSQDALMETAGRPMGASSAEEAGPALLLHSSASGRPWPWSHRICVLQGLAADGPDGLGLTPEDALLLLVPLWRSTAAAAVFAGMAAGAKLVLPGPKGDVQQLRVLADRETVTAAMGAPAELQALHDQFRAEGRRPSALKRVIAIGAPCPNAVVRAWRDSFGIELWSACGAAEVAGIAAVGRPPAGLSPLFGVDLELLDADGRPRPHDGVAIGRLSARGPLVSSGGAAPVDTGDLASIDAQGRISILGRADEQVIAAGAQIPAWPIEAAALEHPATAHAAAIDPPRGLDADGPVLVVERRPGALAGKPDYLRFLSERLGGLKLGELLFVNGFPMDAAGRIDKPALRGRLEQLISPPPPQPEPEAEAGPPVAEPVLEPASEPAAAALESEPDPEPVTAPALALAAAAAAAPALFQREPQRPEPEPTRESEAEAEPDPQSEPAEPAEPPSDAAAAEAAAAGPAMPPVEATSEPAAESAPPAEAAVETAAAGELLSLGPLGDASTPEPAPAEPGLFLSLEQQRPQRERRKARRGTQRIELFLVLAGLLAVAPVLMILAGALGVRFGLIDWRIGVGQMILDWPSKLALIGVLGGIFALFAAVNAGFGRYGLRAAFALVLPLATLAGLVGLKSMGASNPPVHDVATDWTQPIAFSPALMRERGPDAFPVEANPYVPVSAGAYMYRRVAEVNGETCPGAKPAALDLPPDQAYARAKSAALAEGLKLFSDAPAAGRLEATATGLVLGLKDDVAIRVTPSGTGSRVDVRSTSRGGVADYGQNCRRVTDLVRLISSQPRSS